MQTAGPDGAEAGGIAVGEDAAVGVGVVPVGGSTGAVVGSGADAPGTGVAVVHPIGGSGEGDGVVVDSFSLSWHAASKPTAMSTATARNRCQGRSGNCWNRISTPLETREADTFLGKAIFSRVSYNAKTKKRLTVLS
jgi:hypothetical protein